MMRFLRERPALRRERSGAAGNGRGDDFVRGQREGLAAEHQLANRHELVALRLPSLEEFLEDRRELHPLELGMQRVDMLARLERACEQGFRNAARVDAVEPDELVERR